MPHPRAHAHPRALALLLAALVLIPLSADSADAALDSGPARGMDLRFHVNTSLLPQSKENTNVIAQNDGDDLAVIVMDFYTPGGVLIPAASRRFWNVPPAGTRTFVQAVNGGLVPGFRGVGVLSSNQPMNALLVRDIVGPGGVKSYSIHNAHANGGVLVALPYVANALVEAESGDVINTRFAIANASQAVACVTLVYAFTPARGVVGADGKPVLVDRPIPSERCPAGGYPIAAGGQLTLAPDTADGARPMPPQTANTLMAVTVASTEPITVAADIYRQHPDGRQLASYDGFVVGDKDSGWDGVSTRMILPLALKTVDGFWSEYALMNPWLETATATISYSGAIIGDEDTQVRFEVEIEVPSGEGRGHSVFDTDELPPGFIGAAEVESDLPLAALLLRGKMTSAGSFDHEDLYTAVNGVPAERASKSAKFPLVFRRVYQTGPFDGFNSWVSVSVAGGGAANLEITTVNDHTSEAPGCQRRATYTATVTITDTFLFYQNLDDPETNGLNAAPDCLWGGMVITSDRDIIAIANVTTDLLPGDNDGLYNAFQ